jgi:hypothetical protein
LRDRPRADGRWGLPRYGAGCVWRSRCKPSS